MKLSFLVGLTFTLIITNRTRTAEIFGNEHEVVGFILAAEVKAANLIDAKLIVEGKKVQPDLKTEGERLEYFEIVKENFISFFSSPPKFQENLYAKVCPIRNDPKRILGQLLLVDLAMPQEGKELRKKYTLAFKRLREIGTDTDLDELLETKFEAPFSDDAGGIRWKIISIAEMLKSPIEN